MCYLFNYVLEYEQENVSSSNSDGPDYGLSLVIDIEKSQYMRRGLSSKEGIIIALASKSESPNLLASPLQICKYIHQLSFCALYIRSWLQNWDCMNLVMTSFYKQLMSLILWTSEMAQIPLRIWSEFSLSDFSLDLGGRYQNENSQMNFWAESETKGSGSITCCLLEDLQDCPKCNMLFEISLPKVAFQ